MLKALVMCRTGMGSSMMLCIKLRKVIAENKLPVEIEHDMVMGGASAKHADMIITMSDLVPEFQGLGIPVIGIRDIMDTKFMAEELIKVCDSIKK